ncbi:hypothetical protein [Rhodococcus sp. BS-15]|uniref:hypothetical protein n=1 Tax=Rhodococcus sp. BS-15 TaxID=1304954 RepID=UPI001F3C48F6|nr:hypothetical protein [Rhodococcus sp. BS-15]
MARFAICSTTTPIVPPGPVSTLTAISRINPTAMGANRRGPVTRIAKAAMANQYSGVNPRVRSGRTRISAMLMATTDRYAVTGKDRRTHVTAVIASRATTLTAIRGGLLTSSSLVSPTMPVESWNPA